MTKAQDRSIELGIIPLGLMVCFALIGIGILLISTTWGIGTSPDSVRYIDMARNILVRHAIVEQVSSGEFVPMMDYHPLFPVTLAAIGLFGLDPVDGARLVNACLFGASILLVGLTVYRHTNRSAYFAIFGSFIMLTSLDMLRVYSMAWTEPLFLFFGFLGLLLLDLYLENGRAWVLVVASIAIAFAFFDRHVGVTLVATGLAGILVVGQKPFRRKVVDCVVFLPISCSLALLWFVRNLRLGNVILQRSLGFQFNANILFRTAKVGLNTVSVWILPEMISQKVRIIALLVIVIILLTAIVLLLRSAMRRDRVVKRESYARVPYLFLIFAIFYTGLLIFALLFHYASTPLDYRLLSPLYVSGLILLTYLLHLVYGAILLMERGKARHLFQTVFILLCVVFSGFYLWRAAEWVIETQENGQGYTSKDWRQSEVIQAIKDLPLETSIYTNGPQPVYLLTGRPAYRLPIKANPSTGLPNEKFQAQLSAVGKTMAEQDAVLVYFNTIIWWSGYLPSEEEFRKALPLELIKRGKDGAIYKVKLD